MGPETKGTLVCCLYVFVLLFHCYDCSCPNGKAFGPNCNYMCHCANDEQCDDVTGDCKTGCSVDWMGPGCQYRNIAQNGLPIRSDSYNNLYASNAVDDNVFSCTDTGSDIKRSDPPWWQLTFEKKQYITGITFVTRQEYRDQFRNFKIIVGTASRERIDQYYNPPGQECYSHSGGYIRDTKFDIMCDTPISGYHIRIVLTSTNSRLVLCDVRIYGGRNVAFGKSTNASRLASGDLKYVVDGVVNERSWTECAILGSGTGQWWEINLEGHYLILGYSIHVNDGLDVWIQGRTQRNDTWTSIGQRIDVTKRHYGDSFIPPVKVTRIRLIRSIDMWITQLYLCEVQLWAECADDFCGLNCSMSCHCRLKASLSYTDRLAGACEYGCKPGWTGDWKLCDKECQAGTYGDNCTKDCSGHCTEGTACDTTNRQCQHGCEAGWQGSRCNKECPDGRYGQMCTESCSGHCQHGAICSKMNGRCPGGCTKGWKGILCDTKCPDGRYGQMCTEYCSGHCQHGAICSNVNGRCPGGCTKGWKGILCDTKCPDGSYGELCTESCSEHCQNGALCSKTNGYCPDGCTAGWKEILCDTKCDAGTYGSNCLFNCSTNCLNGSCRYTDGHCDQGCTDGWKGHNCEQVGIPPVKTTTETTTPTTTQTTTETTMQTPLLLDTTYDVPVTSPSQNATNDTLQTSSTPVDQTISRQHPSSPNIPVILATVSACNVSVLVVAIIVTIAICRRRRKKLPDSPINIYQQTTSRQPQNENIYIGLHDRINHDTVPTLSDIQTSIEVTMHVDEAQPNAYESLAEVGISSDERTNTIQSKRSSNEHTISEHGAQKGEYASINENVYEEPLLKNVIEHLYTALPNSDRHTVKGKENGNNNGRNIDTRVHSSAYLDMETDHYEVPAHNEPPNDDGLKVKGEEKGNNNERKGDTRVHSSAYIDIDICHYEIPAHIETTHDDGLKVKGEEKGNNNERKEDTRVHYSAYQDMETGHYEVPAHDEPTNDDGLNVKGEEKGNNNERKEDTRVHSSAYIDIDKVITN